MTVLLHELWAAFVQPIFIGGIFYQKSPADFSARHSLRLGRMWHWVILTNPNNPTAQCHTLLIEKTSVKLMWVARRIHKSLPATLPAHTEIWFLLQCISCLETVTCTAVHGPFFLEIGAGEVWLILYPCTKLHLYVSLINRLCFLPSLSIGTKCTSLKKSSGDGISLSDYTSTFINTPSMCHLPLPCEWYTSWDPPHAWSIGGVWVVCW